MYTTRSYHSILRYMNGEQPPGAIEDQNTEDKNLCEGLKLMEVNWQHRLHYGCVYFV